MSVEDLCDTPVTIYTKTTTRGASGGNVDVYSAGTGGLYAAVQPRSGARRVAQGETQSETSDMVYFAAEPVDVSSGARSPGTLRQGDRITVGTRTLLVQERPRDGAYQGALFAVGCKEVF